MGHMHAGMENQYMDQYQNINSNTLHTESGVYDEKSKHIGMYSGCDTSSLQTLFVYFLALPSLLHPSILFNCFFILVYIEYAEL